MSVSRGVEIQIPLPMERDIICSYENVRRYSNAHSYRIWHDERNGSNNVYSQPHQRRILHTRLLGIVVLVRINSNRSGFLVFQKQV